MLERDMFNCAKRDFEEFKIKISDMDSILIPGFYADAIGTIDGRDIFIEFKHVNGRNIREQIISVINQYRAQIEYIGPRGKVILATNNKEESGLEYYDLTKLVFSNKENIKSEIDELVKSSKKLTKKMFYEDSISIDNNLQIEKLKQIGEAKKVKKKDFKIIFVIIAAFVVLSIGVLDGFEIYELSYERLILIGIFVVIMVLPIIRKISINGYSLETKAPTAKDKEE